MVSSCICFIFMWEFEFNFIAELDVLLFACPAFSVCIAIHYRSIRFHNGFDMLAYTICTDYANRTVIDQYYQRSGSITAINYGSKSYRAHYMKIIGSFWMRKIFIWWTILKHWPIQKSQRRRNIASNVWTLLLMLCKSSIFNDHFEISTAKVNWFVSP